MHIILIQQNIIHQGKTQNKNRKNNNTKKRKTQNKNRKNNNTKKNNQKSKQNEEQQIPF